MALQKRLTKVGLAKQTAKASIAANPSWNLGVTGGSVVSAPVTEEDLNPTWSTRMLEGRERTLVVPGAEYEFVAMPKTIGAYLMAVLGTVATTGSADPWTHTFTTADDLPYHTLWATLNSNTYHQLKDVKLDELELTWNPAAALRAKAKWVGCDMAFLAAAPTGGTDERPGIDGALVATGGQFQVDGSTVRVKSGSIKFMNNLDVIRDATKVIPDDVFPGGAGVAVSLTVVPDDLLTFRKVITGATNGTTVSGSPLSGTCSLKWVKDAQHDLTITVNKFYYATDYPEVDPDGGPVEITIEGVAAVAAAGAAYSAVLRSAQATF